MKFESKFDIGQRVYVDNPGSYSTDIKEAVVKSISLEDSQFVYGFTALNYTVQEGYVFSSIKDWLQWYDEKSKEHLENVRRNIGENRERILMALGYVGERNG